MSVTRRDEQAMNTENTQQNLTEYVTAMIGGQLFGLPIVRVQDVFVPERLTRVPLAPPEIAGVLNLRGRIVTLIDLRRRFGLGKREDGDLHPWRSASNRGRILWASDRQRGRGAQARRRRARTQSDQSGSALGAACRPAFIAWTDNCSSWSMSTAFSISVRRRWRRDAMRRWNVCWTLNEDNEGVR